MDKHNMINLRNGTSIAKRLTRRKKVVFGVAVLMLITVFSVVFIWNKLYTKTEEQYANVVVVPIEEVKIVALNYKSAGDFDGGLSYYDSQIRQRTDENEKRSLYKYKSGFASSINRHADAIAAAKLADAIKSDLSTTVAYARAYEQSGDKKQAVFYYQKALEQTPKDGLAMRDVYMWEQKISELQR